MGGGKTGDAPGDVRACLRELREWAGAAGTVDGPHGTRRVRPEFAVPVVDALEKHLDGTGPTALYQITRSLLTTGDDLLAIVEDLIAVRDALQQRLAATLEPVVAIDLVAQLNVLIDDLLRDTADQSMRALHADAHTDSLTGAGNRRAFERDALRAVDLAKRNDRQVALGVIDLDGLKRLNDTEGHPAGDRALKLLATGVLSELRAGDGFYRIGGDEFAVLLPEGPAEGLEALITRARETGPAFSYGTSIYPEDGTTLPELLRVADTRLLIGKQRRGDPPQPRVAARRPFAHAAAGALPIVTAVLFAELLRRAVGVELHDALRAMWIGMVALALGLGIPASRRMCIQHNDLRETARCAAPIALVVLVVMSTALVPVRSLGDALTAAELRRDVALAGPPTVGIAKSPPAAVAHRDDLVIASPPVTDDIVAITHESAPEPIVATTPANNTDAETVAAPPARSVAEPALPAASDGEFQEVTFPSSDNASETSNVATREERDDNDDHEGDDSRPRGRSDDAPHGHAYAYGHDKH